MISLVLGAICAIGVSGRLFIIYFWLFHIHELKYDFVNEHNTL